MDTSGDTAVATPTQHEKLASDEGRSQSPHSNIGKVLFLTMENKKARKDGKSIQIKIDAHI